MSFDHSQFIFIGFHPLNLTSRSELRVKIIEVNVPDRVVHLEGHTKGVRAVSWDPSGTCIVRTSSLLNETSCSSLVFSLWIDDFWVRWITQVVDHIPRVYRNNSRSHTYLGRYHPYRRLQVSPPQTPHISLSLSPYDCSLDF